MEFNKKLENQVCSSKTQEYGALQQTNPFTFLGKKIIKLIEQSGTDAMNQLETLISNIKPEEAQNLLEPIRLTQQLLNLVNSKNDMKLKEQRLKREFLELKIIDAWKQINNK